MSSLKNRSADILLNQVKSKTLALKALERIREKYEKLNKKINVMHVCGTHEATVARSGIRSLLPSGLRIIAGPGCPVCVCPADHVTAAIQLAEQGCLIATFGDMFKVPDGSLRTLAKAKAQGNDIRIVYSVLDALNLAKKHPNKNVVWLGIGFETTVPMTAYALLNDPPSNFYVLSDFRLVPPAMHVLNQDPEFDLDGYILPGHVSTIIGTKPYEEFPKKYGTPGVIAGFEATDFLIGLDKLLELLLAGRKEIFNAYPRVVKPEGNTMALKVIEEVFQVVDAKWRGVGVIPLSGLELKPEFDDHNARFLLKQPIEEGADLAKGCICGKVILGKAEPETCPHFLRRCTPETPIGPCMVSDEGTCRIRAKYQMG